MRVITQVLLRRLVIMSIFTTSTLLAGVWLTQSLRFIQVIVNHNVSLFDYLTLIGFLVPDLLAQILPICIFISLLFVYNRVIHDHELAALRASGHSNWQLAKPALILVGIAMSTIALMNIYVIPTSYRLFRNYEHQIRNELTSIFLQDRAFSTLRGVTVYIKNRELNGTLNDIFIYYTDKDHQNPHSYAVIAHKGKMDFTGEHPRLLLQEGIREEVDLKSRQSTFFRFQEISYDLTAIVSDNQPRSIKPYERSIRDLLTSANKSKDPILKSRMRAEAHQRILLPFLVPLLALTVLNVLLGGPMKRQGNLFRMVSAVFIAAAIYTSLIAIINFNRHFAFAIPLSYIVAAGLLIFGFLNLEYPIYYKPPKQLPGKE